MIKSENIICVSYSTWEGPYTKSVVQLMSLLAENNRVLYVEYPFTIKDVVYAMAGKSRAPLARILGLRRRAVLKETPGGAWVLHWVLPPLIPVNSIRNDRLYRIILKADTWIYRRSLTRAIRSLNLADPVMVYAYNPIFGEQLTGRLGQKADIYYCYDGFPQDRRGIRAWHADRRFPALADGVIVSSDFLRDQKLVVTPNVCSVKNGVDFELFNRSARTAPSPGESRKKIGYIGSIDQRFDLETVRHAVVNLPGYDFEFTGDVRNETVRTELLQYSNVAFLPPVRPEEVPERLRGYDAGIIPYLCNEINRNVYPLKINEFLAVGVPVVLTRFADLPEFSGNASFASSKEEFLSHLVEAVTGDSREKTAGRIEFARSNSWKARAEEFAAAIRTFTARKTARVA